MSRFVQIVRKHMGGIECGFFHSAYEIETHRKRNIKSIKIALKRGGVLKLIITEHWNIEEKFFLHGSLTKHAAHKMK